MRLNRNVRRFSQPLSITTCTDKLVQNDPSFVELSLERLGENFDLDEFVFALKANNTVKHVCFSGTFVRELQLEQWRKMLESVGNLKTLEELQIWCSCIPIDAFRETISKATGLKKVYFFRVTLSGNQSDFDGFADVLKDHESLQDFRIGGFKTKDETISMDRVVEALAVMPRLEVVSLQLTGLQTATPFRVDTLSALFDSLSITDLYLSRLGLSRDHFTAIAGGISSNNTLRVLDLFGNTVQNEHVILIANALAFNSGLETLVLPCPSEDLTVESCTAISRALQTNTTLSTLNLPRSNLCDDGLLQIAEGLTVNKTLRKIEVGVKKIGERGSEALTKMLERNYDLERLVVSSAEESVKDKVNYFMRLNEVGRGTLLKDGKASREQWVEMLISVRDDLDCLFYFTTVNPSICQFANTRCADVIITEEFRPSRRHTMGTFIKSTPKIPTKNRRASVY